MNSKINFNFHETFPPQIQYISKILHLAIEEYKGSKFEISSITGIPTGESSGKVVPHIKYASFMNLINYKATSGVYELSGTDLGKVIYREDPYLMDDLTLEILQYYITHEEIGAPQWSFLFRSYICEYNSSVKTTDINNNFSSLYGKDPELGPLKSMYDAEDFARLEVFEYKRKTDQIVLKSKWAKTQNQYLYAYTLLDDWEMHFNSKPELTIDEIIRELKWSRGFSLDFKEAIEALEMIASCGAIRINKQLEPITIIKNGKAKEIMNLIYSNML